MNEKYEPTSKWFLKKKLQINRDEKQKKMFETTTESIGFPERLLMNQKTTKSKNDSG